MCRNALSMGREELWRGSNLILPSEFALKSVALLTFLKQNNNRFHTVHNAFIPSNISLCLHQTLDQNTGPLRLKEQNSESRCRLLKSGSDLFELPNLSVCRRQACISASVLFIPPVRIWLLELKREGVTRWPPLCFLVVCNEHFPASSHFP